MVRQLGPAGPFDVVRDVAGSLEEAGEVTDATLLAALALIGPARTEMDDTERRLIDEARRRRISWKTLGQTLGLTSPQGAQARRARLEPRS